MGINQSSPTCAANACLNQVIGHADNNGVAQYFACSESFGIAQATSYTTLAPISTYISTVTSTVSTTPGVVVEISTSVETVYVSSTSYDEVFETVTEYTTTNVLTATTTVVQPATSATALKLKNKRKRGGCNHHPSAIPSSSSAIPTSGSALPTSSSVPPSSSSAIPSSNSAIPSSSSASSPTSTPPVPIATDCPSLEAYSSACSCIYAATDATLTYGIQADDTTVLVTSTATATAIPSLSTSVTTTTLTVTVPIGATTTLTSTIRTATTTTTTLTSTRAPLPTQYLVVNNGPRAGRYVVSRSNEVRVDMASTTSENAQAFVLPPDGGPATQLAVLGVNPRQVYAGGGEITSVLFLQSGTRPNRDAPVLCTNVGGVVSCGAYGIGFHSVYDCGMGGLYVGSANPSPSTCVVVQFRVVTLWT